MLTVLRQIDEFLTEERARGLSVIAFISFLIIMGWVGYLTVFVHWGETYKYGYDFSSFWAAAKLATAGNAHWAFDIQTFDALQDMAARVRTAKLYWHYPPTYVALIYPLGLLSPPAALLTFTGLSIFVWAMTVRVMIPTQHWTQRLPVFLCPAFYMTIIGGQNGAFTAALLCLFVLGIQRNKDWMIIAACTLLLYKPHFGVLMPLVLLATGRYKAIAWTVLTGSLFVGWSIWMTGWEYVEAFIANQATLENVISKTGLIDKQHTLFAFLASLEINQSPALIAQIIFALGIMAMTWIAWRSDRVSLDLKIAVFLIGSVLISPYAFVYDAAPTVIGMWYLHRATKETRIPGQNLVIAYVWLAPYVNRIVHEYTGISWAFLGMAFLVFILSLHIRRELVANPA